MEENYRIALVGLGYVGLPLAVEFSKKYNTHGFDTSETRVSELLSGVDKTLELSEKDLNSSNVIYTSNLDDIKNCNIYIITVPTPIDENNIPDLSMVGEATTNIAKILNKGDIVIYESTVYPGLTEEFCVPIIERESGLKYNKQFYCGYSPERINPGDKEHKIKDIVKVTSGSTSDIATLIDNLYRSIIPAGTYLAQSIKVAEMAKVIENTQRDVNIALINEFAQICNKLDIDTEDVLKASETKWNFIPFRPGLVGGHCIGIDPYYLTYKCEQVGHKPEVILSGRLLNDNMHNFIAEDVISLMEKKKIELENAKILIMGFTFKENCPDYRNSRSFNLKQTLEQKGFSVDVYDPWINNDKIHKEFHFLPVTEPEEGVYDAIILTVAHNEFISMGENTIRSFGKDNHILYDMKYILPASKSDARL